MNIKNILTISIPLFIIHAFEKFIGGLLKIDPVFRWIEIRGFSVHAFYFFEQCLLIGMIACAIYKPKRLLLLFIGLIFIFELTHIIPAIQQMSYYPGLITAIPLVILGVFYWKALLPKLSRQV